MASQVKNAAWLEWMAGLMGLRSRQTQTAAFSPGRFHCQLEELPLHLIPPPHVETNHEPQNSLQPLFLNPHCLFLTEGRIPEEFQGHRHLVENFDLRRTVAWVRDPATGAMSPFWLGPRLQAVVACLRLGEPVQELPTAVRLLLAAAGILVREGESELGIARWKERVRAAAPQFQGKGYVTLSNLIHPFNIAALRRYYRRAVRRRAFPLGDDQCPLRYGMHNESVARFFHHQIAKALEAIVGEAIKPSYVYFASYMSGSELKKHTDRAQCEFSMTLCLDFSPEPESTTAWPIRLDTPDGPVTIHQRLGDGLVYRGTKVPHYRDVLAAGHMSTSFFFHYVPADFSGPLD